MHLRMFWSGDYSSLFQVILITGFIDHITLVMWGYHESGNEKEKRRVRDDEAKIEKEASYMHKKTKWRAGWESKQYT